MTQVPTGDTTSAELAVSEALENGGRPTTRKGLGALIEQNLGEIEKALPKGVMDADRFARIIFTEFRKTPKLLLCTPESFLGALFQTAQLGLEPGGQLGHAFLLPYNGKDRTTKEEIVECQLQVGYKGYVELGGRRGLIIRARELRANDDFSFDLGSNEYLHHSWKPGDDRGDVIAFWGKVVYPDGKVTFTVMELDEINKRRDRSSAYQYEKTHPWAKTPWTTDYDAMARKTVIRAMVPQIALAPELQTALRADEAVIERTPTGDLSYLYRDSIDAKASGSGAAAVAINTSQGADDADGSEAPPAASVKAVLADIETDEARAEARAALVEAYGDAYEDSDPQVVDWLLGWLDAPEADQATGEVKDGAQAPDGAQTGTEQAQAPAEGTQAPPPAADGDPGPQAPGEAAPEAIQGVPDDLLKRTQAAIAHWDFDLCKRVLGEWGLPRTGSHEAMRVKLLMLLAPERAKGNKAAEDLF